MMRNLVPEMVPGEQNLRMGSLNQSWVFRNWFSNMIRFKGANDPASSGKVGMGKGEGQVTRLFKV